MVADARVTTAVVAAFALIVLAAACGGASPAEREGAGGDQASAIRLTDAADRAIHLPRPARRVVSLIPATTEIIIKLGAGDRLAARTDYDEQAALADLPSVGGGLTPSLEVIASVRPDLVIAWRDAGSRNVITRLRDLGTAVYAVRLESVDGITRTIEDLGRLLGLPAAADSLVRAIRSGITAVRDAVAGRPRPTVMYLMPGEPPVTAGSGTYIHELIRIAGGRNAFADLHGWPRVNVEEVLSRQPDVLVIPVRGVAARPLARLATAPGWSELDAVRAGRVFPVDAAIFNRPGPRVAVSARRLAARLHPEAFGADSAAPGADPTTPGADSGARP